MGLGLFQLQQRRAPDHPKLSVGAEATGLTNGIPHRSCWLGHDRQLLRRKGRTVVKMKRRVQPAVPKITVRNLQRTVPVKVADLQRFAQKAAKLCLRLPRKSKMDLNELREISVLIVSDGRMASLHRQFMNESGPTDVITFQHGEIFISAETARRNAQRFGNALARELRLYVVHGLLHLHGFDDRDESNARKMEIVQRRILNQGVV